jgi:hypothetical protein
VTGFFAHTAGSGKPAKSPAAVTSAEASAGTLSSVSRAAGANRARAVIPAASGQAAVVPAPPPPAPTTPTGCYPVSNAGSCYEPGEYCRGIDRGTSGVAGDGNVISCRDASGWRWEPA